MCSSPSATPTGQRSRRTWRSSSGASPPSPQAPAARQPRRGAGRRQPRPAGGLQREGGGRGQRPVGPVAQARIGAGRPHGHLLPPRASRPQPRRAAAGPRDDQRLARRRRRRRQRRRRRRRRSGRRVRVARPLERAAGHRRRVPHHPSVFPEVDAGTRPHAPVFGGGKRVVFLSARVHPGEPRRPSA